ncbi:TIGR03084 family metal-binding protein [Actinomadura sp. NEAU-AAG7]|uniref:TIGR03084 family metal-binding protein n=1 Tax=Actinomadura sp. NEAU-AAG7 TaxID=2839640 RepID=UPI001BE47D04|nr:TIGR03084 family metal-binding protein [Actinomadura sp. NEAU-AAG7]MBT2212859.1 TIGR03084 family protein [Actinomadura sp. NEAU-AAG7]
MTDPVVTALIAEGDALDRMVTGIAPDQWKTPTPAPGWSVSDQIAHLTFVYGLAGMAASDPDAFKSVTEAAAKDFQGAVNAAVKQHTGAPDDMLAAFRAQRTATEKALAALPGDRLVPWLVRPIPAAVLAAAGMMELFAHGQDIADAVGVRREATDRLMHVVVFAILVQEFGYQARGETQPDTPFRFEITAPSGAVHAYGPADAEQRVSGPAEDFCLLVTRRRHRDDLKVVAVGAEADHWLDIAQAYRGPAGEGRRPGQFA